jgi:hypothetical protein
MRPLKIMACLAIAQWILSGCATDYALLYINTIDKNTGMNFGARIYSGNSGQYLVDSPSYIVLHKQQFSSNPNITLISEQNCYQSVWQVVTVTNWAHKREDIFLPEYKNEALLLSFITNPCSDGTTPPSLKP